MGAEMCIRDREEAAVLSGRVWLADMAAGERDWLLSRLASWARPVFPLEGRDALALGAAPGPVVGAALRQVREWWLAAGCVADGEACRARLAEALKNWGA